MCNITLKRLSRLYKNALIFFYCTTNYTNFGDFAPTIWTMFAKSLQSFACAPGGLFVTNGFFLFVVNSLPHI